MKLTIARDDGKEQVVEATPEALEAALRDVGTKVEFIVVEDEAERRLMQTNGEQFEYGEQELGLPRHFRAHGPAKSFEDTLRVFVAFTAGSDEWRTLCDWTDVTAEVYKRSRPVVVILIVGAAAAAAVWFLFSVLLDAFG